MKHTIKLITLVFMLATILTLTGCPGPVNNYVEPVVVPEYTIEVNAPNGKADYPRTAKEGDSVTLTITPNNSYELENITVIDDVVSLSGEGNTRTFTMPAENVVINVTFKAIESDTTDEPEQTPENPTDNGDTEEDEENEEEDNPTDTTIGEEEEETEGNETDNGSEETQEHVHSPDYETSGYCECGEYKWENRLTINIRKDGSTECKEVKFSFEDSNTKMGLTDLIHLKTEYKQSEIILVADQTGTREVLEDEYNSSDHVALGFNGWFVLVRQ